MLRSFFNQSSISKRFQKQLVLARKGRSGTLDLADFDRTDKAFCFAPRLTASATINGHDGICNIGSVRWLVSANQTGHFKRLNQDRKPWTGFIGPVHHEAEFAFYFDENPPFNWDNWEQLLTYDIVSYLHDPNRLLAVNIQSNDSELFTSKPTSNLTNEKIWPGIPGTEYVLAYWNNGQLTVVDFDREDKHFSRKPRLTAEVLINGKKGIVTIDRITKLVETSQIGRIKRIITKVEEGSPWIGIIGSADNDANDIVFILNNNTNFDWRDRDIDFIYDITTSLHDSNLRTAVNVRPIPSHSSSRINRFKISSGER